MQTDTDVLDMLIVGGGPTGLYGAFYAGLRGLRTRIIDSLEQLGGQLITLYPEKFVYDVGGYPAVLARTLAAELTKQALQFRTGVSLGEQVETIRRDNGLLVVVTSASMYRTRTVLIAAGGGAFTPKRLTAPGCARFEGRGFTYLVRDLQDFREKSVMVIGGGDAAVDRAVSLARVAGRVTLAHRRETLRASRDSLRRLEGAGVAVRVSRELVSVDGGEHVETAVLRNSVTGASESLDVDAIVVEIGFLNTLDPLHSWGLEVSGGGLVVSSHMETSVPGIYAAGDIAAYPGKLKLIATGFAEAAVATNHAAATIRPTAIVPEYSTLLVPRLRRAEPRTGGAT